MEYFAQSAIDPYLELIKALHDVTHGEVFSTITPCPGLFWKNKISLGYFQMRSEILSAERYGSSFETYQRPT